MERGRVPDWMGKKRAVKRDTLLTTHCMLSARYWGFGDDRRWGQEEPDTSEGRMGRGRWVPWGLGRSSAMPGDNSGGRCEDMSLRPRSFEGL